MMYIPKAMKQMRTPVILLSPAETKRYNGVAYQEERQEIGTIFVNWKSYGGTETTINDVYSIDQSKIGYFYIINADKTAPSFANNL